jgi:hypothetical protein
MVSRKDISAPLILTTKEDAMAALKHRAGIETTERELATMGNRSVWPLTEVKPAEKSEKNKTKRNKKPEQFEQNGKKSAKVKLSMASRSVVLYPPSSPSLSTQIRVYQRRR